MTNNLPEDGASWGVHTQAERDISRDDQSPSSNPTQTEDCRMEEALRDLEKKMATVAESAAQAPMDAEILVLAFAHMRASILSALTLKSEKAASSLKGSDVGEVGE
jgi:hypothetical protein